MPSSPQLVVHRMPPRDSYGHLTTIPLDDITQAAAGVATINNNDNRNFMPPETTTFTATIAGVTGSGDESDINGARVCTYIADLDFSIDVNTTALTYDATAATITVQVAKNGAGVPLDRGNMRDKIHEYSGS